MCIKGSVVAFVLTVFLLGCRSDNYNEVLTQYKQESLAIHGFRDSLCRLATDTIADWARDSLDDALCMSNNTWQVDSFMVFNSSKTKSIGLILISMTNPQISFVQDDISYLLCEKRNGKWCFFRGATMVLPRESTTGDTLKPASLKQLSEIGRKQLLLSAYIKPWPWSKIFLINERLFKTEFEIAVSEQQKKDWINRVGRRNTY